MLTVDLTNVPNHKFMSRRSRLNQTYYEVYYQVELSALSALEYAVSIDGICYGLITASYT
jgi:hypothetical protein